jgi:hypothetical protein
MKPRGTLIERSFEDRDVPPWFFLATHKLNLSRKRKQLAKGKMLGVRGISGGMSLPTNWERCAVLAMRGPSLLRANPGNLSRVMYGNPHYMFSKGMAAFLRVGEYINVRSALEAIYDNAATFSGGRRLTNFDTYYERAERSLPPINGLRDLARNLVAIYKRADEPWRGRAQPIDKWPIEKVMEWAWRGAKSETDPLAQETEWRTKKGYLNIVPRDTWVLIDGSCPNDGDVLELRAALGNGSAWDGLDHVKVFKNNTERVTHLARNFAFRPALA